MTSHSDAATELFELALECIKEGNLHMANELFTQSLHREERPRTYVERARLHQSRGELKNAAKDLDRAVALCKAFSKDWSLYPKLNSLRKQIASALEQERIRKTTLRKLSLSRDLDGLLAAFQLTQFRDAIMKQSEMAVRIKLEKNDVDSFKSKFGGFPDLPDDVTWPCTSSGRPLSFLAQISLPDLSQTCASEICEGSGLISFFYDAEEQPWGFDPMHRNGWKVFHFPNEKPLNQTAPPPSLPEHCIFEGCKATFQDELTFPTYENENDLKLSLDESSRYFAFCQEWYGDLPHHHLLGHPQLVQGPGWKVKCQLASNGVYVGDPNGYESDRARELETGAEQWKLLLQVDIDEMTGMEWGDGGYLYFCVNQSALEKNDLSNVWTILQCH